jgi:branched-chain amino acid transport system ATP-binding protein
VSEALQIEDVSRSYGGVRAVIDVSATVSRGEIVGLVGPNGAGKTTLFDVVCGFLAADSGSVTVEGQQATGLPPHRIARLGVARLFQEVRLARALSVSENVLVALDSRLRRTSADGRSVSLLCTHRTVGASVRAVLASVGLQERVDDIAGTLSYGQQKLLALAMCLGADPNVLLLDEPFAGIAPSLIERTITILTSLRDRGAAILVIDHNVEALRRCADRLVAMSAGRIIAVGPTGAVLQSQTVLDTYLHPGRNV